MKCPQCQSKVEFLRSAVDNKVIRLCSNDACDWQELPEGAAIPEVENLTFNTNEAWMARRSLSEFSEK